MERASPDGTGLGFSFEDMRDDGRAAAADVLGHANRRRPGHLAAARHTAQLLDDFHDLIDARRPDGVTARFESPARGDGDAPLGPDLTFQAQPRSLTTLRKAARFQ